MLRLLILMLLISLTGCCIVKIKYERKKQKKDADIGYIPNVDLPIKPPSMTNEWDE